MGTPLVVKLKSYSGKDTYLEIASYDHPKDWQAGLEPNRDFIYLVVDNETGEELDIGYRSKAETRKYWPDAVNS